MALMPTAKRLAGAALHPMTPKARTSRTRFTATEITDTSEYLTNFCPVGERANSMRALGRRSTKIDRTQQPEAGTRHGSLQRVPASDLAQPPCARLGRADLGGAVDSDEAKGRAVAEGPLEVVEGAPVRVAEDVDPVGQARLHTAQGPSHVLDALGVVARADAVLGDEHR